MCDNGNVCDGAEYCSPTLGCQADQPKVCLDSNLCNGTETCHPTLGCQPGINLVCDNGNVCDGAEYCSPTLGCQAGDALICNDNNVCTGTETCHPVQGCKSGIPLTCDDGNVCNGVESCSPTAGCQNGTALVCSNGNVCDGIETCDAELGCLPGMAMICDDQDVCNGLELCSPTLGCLAGSSLVCSDGDVCNGVETCDMDLGCLPGVSLDCTDQNLCNGTESCHPVNGCTAGIVFICDDSLPCTTDYCNPLLGCQVTIQPDGTSCPGGAAFKCVTGVCKCVPQCVGLECGNDQCGGSCGTCTSPKECVLGLCQSAGIDPEGTFTITPPVVYSCTGININIQSVSIVESGGAVTVTFYPTMCAPLTGTWNPTTKTVTAGSDVCWSGSCQHTYMFTATFTDNNNVTAFFRCTPQQGGMNLCPGCSTQIKNGLVGTRN